MKKLFKLSPKYHGQFAAIFAWHPNGNFLATAGSNGLVHIFDRQGAEYDEIGLDLQTPVLALEWDDDGATLAILQQGSSVVALWDVASRTTHNLSTNMKDPTFISWSMSGLQLAIGFLKGNLILYNKANRKMIPVMGKHSKRVTSGAWNSADCLILGSEDNLITISNAVGDTIGQRELTMTPNIIKFGQKRGDLTKAPSHIVAIGVTKALVLLDIEDLGNPIELTFQAYYGNVVHFEWLEDGLLLICFSEGYLVIISTRIDEIGEEVYSHRFFTGRIFAACYSQVLNRVAISGNNGIKVIDMNTREEISSDAIKLADSEDNEACGMKFTSDGQILTISSGNGIVQNYLVSMPKIFDHYNSCIAYLSSLRELSIVDVLGSENILHLTVSIEPSFVAIGPRHVAVGMNNHVWYYQYDVKSSDRLVNEQQYLSRVTSVKLNRDFAAVLCDGKASVHAIERAPKTRPGTNEMSKVFSTSGSMRDDRSSDITSIAMSKDFFIYSTANGTGTINFFYLTEWKSLDSSTYRHEDGVGIVYISSNQAGTRIAFLDSKRRGFILNSSRREAIPITGVPITTLSILWDVVDPTVLVSLQPTEFSLFQYTDITIHGPEVRQLGYMKIQENGEFITAPLNTPLPSECSAILICDGILTCQHSSGKISSVTSCTHDKIQKNNKKSSTNSAIEKAMFEQLLSLFRLDICWNLAVSINSDAYWLALAGRAMHIMDISMAKRVYRHLGDAGMVFGLSRIEGIEEKNLLAGHILLLFGDYAEARRLFLNSSDPMAALDMHKNLLQWEQALKLADSLAVDLIPQLSISYATQLEFNGEFESALRMYEHATNVTNEMGDVVVCEEKYRKQSSAGIARCTFRVGDLRRGMRLVAEIGEESLHRECAVILETMKQSADAAALYEQGHLYDKAALIYIQLKNLVKATPLMGKVKTPKILIQFGKAKEAIGDFSAASDAYEAAEDMDNVVRLQLGKLNNPEKAFSIVRATKSSDGTLAAATFCLENGNYVNAIEFLLLANKEEEAFQVALNHNEIPTFTKICGESISLERAAKIAQYYEQNMKLAEAAEFYQICRNYHKSLRLYLQCGDSELGKAIDVVGKARNDMLTHTLIDYLMGDADGIPKDPNHIFRLYMVLGNYSQAGKTALIISRQEQELGNYKAAHDVLVEIHRQLVIHKIHVTRELQQSLMLLHSYSLVKHLVKKNNHTAAAYMLVRVVKHISKFPIHVVNILISAVIECQRAGLRAYSYDFATTLMRPEYRNAMDKDIRRKIETIVRRPNKEQNADAMTPCPYCEYDVPEAELDCAKCKNWIPYCIVTGYHMVKKDWTMCPICMFPALYSQFINHLEEDEHCPMCDSSIASISLKQFSEDEVNIINSSQSDDKAP